MKRISWLLIVPLVLAAASAPMACVESLTFKLDQSNGGAGGAGGSSTGSGGMTSSTGGMGGSTSSTGSGGSECKTLSDCNAGECKTATACTNGACVWQYTSEGTLTASQLYGDCEDRKCDGMGGVKPAPGDMVKDAYDWGNPCYLKACNATGDPMKNDGVMCTTPWGNTGGKCADFKCVECVMDVDCGTDLCRKDRCVPATCDNTMPDPGETDIDCGGPDCPPCSADKTCGQNADCEGTCDTMGTMKCVAPSCADTIMNGDETDIDCGGMTCIKEMPAKKCQATQKCLVPADCESGVCKSGLCQDPTCSDYTQNQGEEGIDCGGPCSPCAMTP